MKHILTYSPINLGAKHQTGMSGIESSENTKYHSLILNEEKLEKWLGLNGIESLDDYTIHITSTPEVEFQDEYEYSPSSFLADFEKYLDKAEEDKCITIIRIYQDFTIDELSNESLKQLIKDNFVLIDEL